MAMTPLMTFINTALVSNNSRLNLYLVSNFWYEIKRVKGPKPKPRYRHTASISGGQMVIFGGVDTDQKRFNDLFTYDIEKRKWTAI